MNFLLLRCATRQKVIHKANIPIGTHLCNLSKSVTYVCLKPSAINLFNQTTTYSKHCYSWTTQPPEGHSDMDPAGGSPKQNSTFSDLCQNRNDSIKDTVMDIAASLAIGCVILVPTMGIPMLIEHVSGMAIENTSIGHLLITRFSNGLCIVASLVIPIRLLMYFQNKSKITSRLFGLK